MSPTEALALVLARRARRRGRAGFTLVELTVAMFAGLLVAMGIVALSREATRTFHEEVRNAASEAAMRSAVDRLRDDLAKAAFMSTGNIMTQPKYAVSPGLLNTANINPGMNGIRSLAGILLYDGGSTVNTPLSGVQLPALQPDRIRIGGNLTSPDQFDAIAGAPSGSCRQFNLQMTSSPIVKLASIGPQAAMELRNMFQPAPMPLATQFIVRVIDRQGCVQFLATCPVSQAAGFNGSQAFVLVDEANTPVQSPATTGGVCGVTPNESVQINPVQVVQWELLSPAQETAQYIGGLDNLPMQPGTPDPNKYDLVRTYVDAFGNTVPQTAEVVAEYAVDLDFAFSVDTGLNAQLPNLTTFAFDDQANNPNWAYDVQSKPPLPGVGPQRIRSVRARMATRAAQPDRTMNVPLANYQNQEFMYRYCVNPPCSPPDQQLRWARVRTVTTEVALENQGRNFY